jgi:hypothetical protein
MNSQTHELTTKNIEFKRNQQILGTVLISDIRTRSQFRRIESECQKWQNLGEIVYSFELKYIYKQK